MGVRKLVRSFRRGVENEFGALVQIPTKKSWAGIPIIVDLMTDFLKYFKITKEGHLMWSG